ncbi:hypothetical protein Thini_1669 [Thiothrix nivea DSM 5205]|uniref:Uncharacterized protein n=1 Tax=Thiothrix nivea (strain ATCC 35100 / DSM 5205 / JP2) TaxID=870187 RepID=A0A656HDI8_THINJ|nr:hypothetical protein Thini_1669 [Thiothrix nivea DSM 5205]
MDVIFVTFMLTPSITCEPPKFQRYKIISQAGFYGTLPGYPTPSTD